ncbi:hypothetical protein HDU93_000685 [Gonapodya sp. JEL0774]|nr:hypothetical protein HDU93_000685 [Gonapodya sp. JEL0774]
MTQPAVQVAPVLEQRPFPLVKFDASTGAFVTEPVLFDFHPVYGRDMGLSKGVPVTSAVFLKLDDKQKIPVHSIPAPYYLLVLRGTLSVATPSSPKPTTFAAGGFFHIPSAPNSAAILAPASGSPVLALALLTTPAASSQFAPLPKDRSALAEDFRFTALIVTPSGGSAVSDEHAKAKLDSIWKVGGVELVAAKPHDALGGLHSKTKD